MQGGRGSATANLVVAFWDVVVDGSHVSRIDRIPDLQGGWDLGKYEPGLLGLADRQLRVLGWYWPRRYADFCDFVLVPTKLAYKHQQSRRSDDDLRGYLCSHLSRDSRRACLVSFLVDSLPEFESLDVASVP